MPVIKNINCSVYRLNKMFVNSIEDATKLRGWHRFCEIFGIFKNWKTKKAQLRELYVELHQNTVKYKSLISQKNQLDIKNSLINHFIVFSKMKQLMNGNVRSLESVQFNRQRNRIIEQKIYQFNIRENKIVKQNATYYELIFSIDGCIIVTLPIDVLENMVFNRFKQDILDENGNLLQNVTEEYFISEQNREGMNRYCELPIKTQLN